MSELAVRSGSVVFGRANRADRRQQWSRVRQILRPQRARVGLLGVVSFFGGGIEAAFLVIITRTALALASGRSNFGVIAGQSVSLRGAVLVGMGLLIVRLALSLLGLWLSTRVSVGVVTDARSALANAYLHTSWAQQQTEPAGRLQELVMSFSSIAGGVAGHFAGMYTAGLSLFALLVVSVAVNPWATIVVVVALIFLGGLLGPLRRRIRARAAVAATAQMSFATAVSELGSLGMEMQSYGVRDRFVERVDALIQADARARRSASLVQGSLSPVYTTLAYAALLGGLALATTVGTAELTGVAAVMLVMMRSLGYGQMLQSASAGLSASMPYLDLLDEATVRYVSNPAPGGDTRLDQIGAIEANSVTFAYQPGVDVLHDLNFSIAPGEVIGVVGPSGSGKSTLVQLLLGLREPTEGSITVDGVSLASIDRRSWTSKTAFVAQDATLLSDTVAANITFFRDGIDFARVRRAAEQAHVADEVSAIDGGFDSSVGERGARLSGGQRQRVSIARALAGDPQLLIMDEPTSALDVRSEAYIRQTVADLKGSVTIVIIAHRLSTLEVCDRIMIIQDGVLKAFDDPEVLARDNDFFREALALSGMTA